MPPSLTHCEFAMAPVSGKGPAAVSEFGTCFSFSGDFSTHPTSDEYGMNLTLGEIFMQLAPDQTKGTRV